MQNIPPLKFADGNECPCIGLGTSTAEHIGKTVCMAIDVGYRHFDCAHGYLNESEIGQAFQDKIKDGSIKREYIFVTSKLWMTYHRPEMVIEGCRQSLKNLKLHYLDLFLMHWPISFKEIVEEKYPKDADGNVLLGTTDFIDTWKAMQSLVDQGLVKSIGISNFNSKQIQRILSLNLTHPISCLQIEVSPYLRNEKLIKFCKENNICVTAYSPLGAGNRPHALPDDPVLLNDVTITLIASKYKKTPAQVLLRWGIQRGYAVIPKSSSLHRLKENFSLFDFILAEEDVNSIDTLDRNFRYFDGSWGKKSEYFPFNEEF